jgi:hypothetical protein
MGQTRTSCVTLSAGEGGGSGPVAAMGSEGTAIVSSDMAPDFRIRPRQMFDYREKEFRVAFTPGSGQPSKICRLD